MRLFSLVIALVGSILVANPLAAQPAAGKPTPKIGEIIIVGNNITQDRVIRELIGFNPGQVLDPADLRRAQKKLADSKFFSLKEDEKPEVKVLNPDGVDEFRDILVRIIETSTASTYFEFGINRKGAPVVRYVREERNYDPECWPTCWEDITEGRAFRGAGVKHRLALIEIDLMNGLSEFLVPADSAPGLMFSQFASKS